MKLAYKGSESDCQEPVVGLKKRTKRKESKKWIARVAETEDMRRRAEGGERRNT